MSLPHYVYYEVENLHENPDVPIFYNIDSKVDHMVMTVADMKEIYGENVSKIPYIAPALDNALRKTEKVSPYWANQGQTEEITDEHLVTLGRHQQQFLSSFKPKPKETADISLETSPTQ